MNLFKLFSGLLEKARIPQKSMTARRLSATATPAPASTRAKAMLGKIRRGQYEFSAMEISEIIVDKKWFGSWQQYFLSLVASAPNRIELQWNIPVFGRLGTALEILDVWHDQRVSSIDFRLVKVTADALRQSPTRKLIEYLLTKAVNVWLQWQGVWSHESLRFVSRTQQILRLYVEWPLKQSPLLKNISVIGTHIDNGRILLYIFRRPPEGQSLKSLELSATGVAADRSRVAAQLTVVFSWLLLGAYAFVLIHVTLPVLGGAFRLMPQTVDTWDRFLLTQVYNLCVIVISYFLLRITMLPLYLKWNKSKQDLAILLSVEERDHQYLRLLTDIVKKMQQTWQTPGNTGAAASCSLVPVESIAQMIELMSRVRLQSQTRLFGMTRMRRGWLQDLAIGYIAIFALEWLYYQGLLTPLPKSIEWVNQIMTRLFLDGSH